MQTKGAQTNAQQEREMHRGKYTRYSELQVHSLQSMMCPSMQCTRCSVGMSPCRNLVKDPPEGT